MPLHADLALELVADILPYVEFQTGKNSTKHFSLIGRKFATDDSTADLSYLKNPPSGYQEPAVDIIGGFNEVAANISSGAFPNEYEFMANLWKVFNSAHDGHFRFLPDILVKALLFRRNVDLVSVSMDGFEIPQIFTHSMSLHLLHLAY